MAARVEGSNSGACEFEITRARQMEDFDRLPYIVRRAVSEAKFDYATSPIRDMCRLPQMSVGEIVEAIRHNDAQYAAHTRLSVWGEHYPS